MKTRLFVHDLAHALGGAVGGKRPIPDLYDTVMQGKVGPLSPETYPKFTQFMGPWDVMSRHAGTYYLLENRQKLPATLLPSEGLLILHVDESREDGDGIVRVIDANPQVPDFGAATFGVSPGQKPSVSLPGVGCDCSSIGTVGGRPHCYGDAALTSNLPPPASNLKQKEKGG